MSSSLTRPSRLRTVALALGAVTAVSLAGPGSSALAEPLEPEVPAAEPGLDRTQSEEPAELAEAPAEEAPAEGPTETVAAVVVEDGKAQVITREAQPEDVDEVSDELADDPGVVDVFVDAPARAAGFPAPSDAENGQQWSWKELGRDQFPWSGESAGVSQTVAVLDTGVDASHEDLDDGRVLCAQGADYSAMEEGGPVVSTGDGCTDVNGHGTHVAGVVSAEWDNTVGVAGVSRARILPVKVLNDEGWGTVSGISAGIIWAVDHGADVINMSIVGDDTGYEAAIQYALDNDVVVVASAGNNRQEGNLPQYPAAVPGVISVAATDELHLSSPFSYQGPTNVISAPGSRILSSVPGGLYESWSGTSMAAPHVAGIVAWYRELNPAATVADIRTAVQATAIDMERPGKDDSTGYGMIDMAELLTGTQRVNPARYSSTLPAAPLLTSVVPRDGGLRATWTPPVWNGGKPIVRYGVDVYRYVCVSGTCDYEYAATAEAPNTATSLTVPGLVNGRTYVALAYARNDTRYGQWSDESPLVRVDAPKIASVTPGPESARVRWTAPSSVDGSAVSKYVVDVYAGSTRVQQVEVSKSLREYRAGGLRNGRAHTFVVTAVGTQGVRVPSNRSAAVTPRDVPGAPRIGTPAAANDAARVYWAAPSDTGGAAVSAYVVKVYAGSRGVKSVTVSGSARSAVVTGLADRASYSFTVTAENVAGLGAPSARSAVVRTT